MDLLDRKGFDTLVWLLVIGLFALFGASAKLLYRWRPTRWTNALGRLMVAVFAAWLVGLSLWSIKETQPHLLLVSTGFAAWLGEELVDRLARAWERRMLGNGNAHDH